MNKLTRMRALLALLFLAMARPALSQTDFTPANSGAIQGFLRRTFTNGNAGMVVGIIDSHGSQVFGAGKLGNGTDAEVNGDTIFEIGSVTKVFTALFQGRAGGRAIDSKDQWDIRCEQEDSRMSGADERASRGRDSV